MKWFNDLGIGAKIVFAFVALSILTGIVGYLQQGHFPSVIFACSLFFGAAIGIFLSGNIKGQVKKLSDLAEKVASGHTGALIEIDAKGEFEKLATCLKSLAEDQKELSNAAIRMSQGDYSIKVPVRDEKDVLGSAMQRCTDSFRSLEQELARMKESAKAGNLSERCKPEAFSGAHAALLNGVNQMLDAIIRPVGFGQ